MKTVAGVALQFFRVDGQGRSLLPTRNPAMTKSQSHLAKLADVKSQYLPVQ